MVALHGFIHDAEQALHHSGGELSSSGSRVDMGSGGGGSSSGRSESLSQAEPSSGPLQPDQSGASFAALLRSVSLREAPDAPLDSSEIVGGPDAKDVSGVRVRLKNYFSRQKQGD